MRQAVVGFITAYDIMSEKPMRYMQSMTSPRRKCRCGTSCMASVSRLFDATELTHIPVMEASEAGEQRLRGLLSGAKARRLLSR